MDTAKTPGPAAKTTNHTDQPKKPKASEEVLRFRLAGGRSVSVVFHGPPPGPKEIDTLMRLLEVSRDQFG